MEDAPEPTNIIWENLEITGHTMRIRRVIAVIIMSIFIFLLFILFTALKSYNGKNKLKYPSTTPCTDFANQFGTDIALFKEFALKDELNLLEDQMHAVGYYMCYCKKYKGSDADTCDMFITDSYVGLAMSNAVSFLVSVFNIVIRTINIKLIEWIQVDTHS